MNKNKIQTSDEFYLRGVTLVEIFVALAVVAVLLACAVSPLKRMSERVDVDIAGQNILYALNSAERSAKRANIPVRVYFYENATENRLVPGFSRHRGVIEFYALPYYAIPEDVMVTLSEGMSVIEYLPDGQIHPEGVISVSSRQFPEIKSEIAIKGRGHKTAPASLTRRFK